MTESDFVSAKRGKGHATPGRSIVATYKTLNAVLRGPDYETPVTYWMPPNSDIGMHDLTSRKAFGGDIYKTRGSLDVSTFHIQRPRNPMRQSTRDTASLFITFRERESDSVRNRRSWYGCRKRSTVSELLH